MNPIAGGSKQAKQLEDDDDDDDHSDDVEDVIHGGCPIAGDVPRKGAGGAGISLKSKFRLCPRLECTLNRPVGGR
ncbi:hypothetical protein [Luteolibacter soli]|uniref:Uncharacterized protein n=1 Tax=Luteolibacter soli TaxID=3135280 RepID=A0ABU9B325_9BACT